MNPMITVENYASLPQDNLVLFDCRYELGKPDQGREWYEQEHLPNAHFLDLEKHLSGPVLAHGGRHPLPDIQETVALFRQRGVNNDSVIVLYDDTNMSYAARAWWLLTYLGHSNVFILDGGITAWRNANYPLTSTIPTSIPGNFIAKPNQSMLISREDIIGNPQILLIDSRAANRYSGEIEPLDKVAGHIPGAINMFWADNYDDQGKLLPAEIQKVRWNKLPKTKQWVVYCGSGVTACSNILSMVSAGINDAKLYPGSWSDWCSYPLDDNWNPLQ